MRAEFRSTVDGLATTTHQRRTTTVVRRDGRGAVRAGHRDRHDDDRARRASLAVGGSVLADADAEARIGGDAYAIQDTPFGIRILVGDIRGKGVGAVSITTTLIGAFREAAHHTSSLEELAERLEHSLERDQAQHSHPSHDEEFTTALIAEIDHAGARRCRRRRGRLHRPRELRPPPRPGRSPTPPAGDPARPRVHPPPGRGHREPRPGRPRPPGHRAPAWPPYPRPPTGSSTPPTSSSPNPGGSSAPAASRPGSRPGTSGPGSPASPSAMQSALPRAPLPADP
ncbi:SpoIIE family protein phosphatase [Streptomyces sp. WAC01325]|uniref:SpoIIE family protein phosphatase n=1 Tax=Streptomyces sp. WAC01325 TaxID=3373094 RepID=UPI003F3E2159